MVEVDALGWHDATAYTLESTYVDDRVRVNGNGRFHYDTSVQPIQLGQAQ